MSTYKQQLEKALGELSTAQGIVNEMVVGDAQITGYALWDAIDLLTTTSNILENMAAVEDVPYDPDEDNIDLRDEDYPEYEEEVDEDE